MVAVDTNVIVRLVVNDDPAQAAGAAQVFRSVSVFVPKSVLLETEWVLRHCYGLDRARIDGALRSVLGLPNVRAEGQGEVVRALDGYAAGLDFADALHLASSVAAREFVTFDRRLAKRAAGLAAIPVRLG